MARQMLMVVLCVLTLGLLRPADATQVIVSPHTFDVGLTRSLEVNCTFFHESSTNMTNLISLILSKSDDDSSSASVYKELASMNIFTSDQVIVITLVNASVSGQISAIGTSFLSLQWAYPSAGVAGIYRCSALGVDRLGHPVEEDHTKQVAASSPGIDQLTEMVKLQQIQMDNMMKVLSQISTSLDKVDGKMSSLVNNFSTFSNEVGVLTSSFSTFNNDVETLTNNVSILNNVVHTLTDNFSTIINDVGTLTNNFSMLNNDACACISDVNRLNRTIGDELKDLNKYKDIFLTTLASEKLYIKSPNYQDRYYLLSKEEPDTDREAQASCLLQGGYLAEVNDVNEHNFIRMFLNSSIPHGVKAVLLGATETEHRGIWVFSHSHHLVNYTVWAPEQPNSDVETCMFINPDHNWAMHDWTCSTSRTMRFLCEIPIH